MKTPSKTTLGIDLGDKKHAICAIDACGTIIDERSITNHRESLRRLSLKHPKALIAMEVGTHSPWISRFLEGLGHRVLVANPRKLRVIYQDVRKSDVRDAQMLAKIARVDETLLYPIEHSSEDAQRDLLQVKLRDNLVRQRVAVISAVRFTLKSLGVGLKSPCTNYFAKCARTELGKEHGDLLLLIEPSLQIVEAMTQQIKMLDRLIEQLGVEKYPITKVLREIGGVGPIPQGSG
jgi:transposase